MGVASASSNEIEVGTVVGTTVEAGTIALEVKDEKNRSKNNNVQQKGGDIV